MLILTRHVGETNIIGDGVEGMILGVSVLRYAFA